MSEEFYLSDLRDKQDLTGLMFFREGSYINIIVDGEKETTRYACDLCIKKVRSNFFTVEVAEGDLFLPPILSRGEENETL